MRTQRHSDIFIASIFLSEKLSASKKKSSYFLLEFGLVVERPT